jgi:hypothetical protein
VEDKRRSPFRPSSTSSRFDSPRRQIPIPCRHPAANRKPTANDLRTKDASAGISRFQSNGRASPNESRMSIPALGLSTQATANVPSESTATDSTLTLPLPPTLDPEIQGQLAIRSKQGHDMALDAGVEVTVVKAGHHTADDRRNRGFPKGFGRRSNWKAENPGSAMVRTMT